MVSFVVVRGGSNAGKFTPKGIVTVDAVLVSHDGTQYVVITVSNSRAGAPLADPESCFIPFKGTFQGSGTSAGASKAGTCPQLLLTLALTTLEPTAHSLARLRCPATFRVHRETLCCKHCRLFLGVSHKSAMVSVLLLPSPPPPC